MAAQVKISGLPVVSVPLGTDYFPIVQGGITKRETATQLLTGTTTPLVSGGIVFQGSSGFLTQDTTNLFWDNTTKVLSLNGYSISLGGNILTHGKFEIDGAFDTLFTITGNTSVTLPTSGTLLSTTSGGYVSEAIGTANQVLVNGTTSSPETGSCTFTLPQDIGTSSVTQFLALGLGGSAAGSVSDLTIGGSRSTQINLTGTITTQNGGAQNGIYMDQTFRPASALTQANSIFINSVFDTGAASIGTASVIKITATASVTNALTNFYGVTIGEVSGATTKNISLGVYNFEAGSSGQFAINSSGTVTGGTWNATTIPVLYGGTGQTTYTNGQLLIGNTTGNTLTKATLTQGTGITITNGTGSITIAADTTALVSGIIGTANQILANSTSGSNQTGNVTLTLPSLVSTGSYESISSNANYAAFTNNTQTTFGSTGTAYYIRNSSAVVNNWMGYSFLAPSGNLAAAVACQMTAQSATEEGDLVLFTRNNSTGLREGARLVGNTNILTLVNPLPATSGGSGQLVYAIGDILYASTTTTLSKLSDVATGNALISGGVNTAPSWGKIGLTTHISGTLAEGNGGTNQTTYTQGDILYASDSNTLSKLAKNTSSTRYLSNTGTSNNPAWAQIDLTNGVTASGAITFTAGGSNTDITLTPNGTGKTNLGGNVLKSGNTLFLYTLQTATSNDKTGDGTVYTIVFDTSKFNINSSFDGTTFTAPVTAKYRFNLSAVMNNIGSGHTEFNMRISINSGSSLYVLQSESPAATRANTNVLSRSGSVIVSLSATDTVVFQIVAFNSTKTIGIGNTSSTVFTTYCSGELIG